MSGGWQERRAILEQALELEPSARDGYLAQACADESELAELRALCALEQSESLLDHSAAKLHAEALDADEREALVGARVDGYEIVELLGRGGTSTVVRARPLAGGDRTEVALKILRRGPFEPETLGRFRAERRVLEQLDHPSIPRLLGAGELDDGRPYLVTECVNGVPIDRYCRDQASSLAERLVLFEEVCAAVHYAHVHLVVHRDLKPSNILVTPAGRPFVLDFGVAKLLDERMETSSWTRPGGRAPMTPSYASPEQLRGAEVSTATDVYSLGVVLHQLLTGALPRAAADGSAARPSRIAGTKGRETTVDPRSLRGDLDTIVACALHPEPSGRFASARHFAEDLRRYRAHEPIEARGPSRLYRLRKLVRRHPLPAASVALVGGTLLTIVAVTRSSLERVRESESIAWRAHADAVYATNALAGVLARLSAAEQLERSEVLAVLAEVEGRIDRELGEGPEAEARMCHAIARVYLGIDDAGRAEKHVRRALELSRDTRGLSRLDIARNLFLLTEIQLERGDAEAAETAQELVDLCTELFGPGSDEAERARTLQARAGA